jgi:hypothetical protein
MEKAKRIPEGRSGVDGMRLNPESLVSCAGGENGSPCGIAGPLSAVGSPCKSLK